jgi:hypothetical protein
MTLHTPNVLDAIKTGRSRLPVFKAGAIGLNLPPKASHAKWLYKETRRNFPVNIFDKFSSNFF